jgi:hypothetical protein
MKEQALSNAKAALPTGCAGIRGNRGLIHWPTASEARKGVAE